MLQRSRLLDQWCMGTYSGFPSGVDNPLSTEVEPAKQVRLYAARLEVLKDRGMVFIS